MFPYEEYVSGRALQSFMINNVDVCAYLCFGYLGMVRYGPALATKVFGPASNADPSWLRGFMIFWNFLLSSFSFFGCIVMVPALLASIKERGLHDSVCVHHEELSYSTPCGTWTGLFVLSKIPELVDTLVLVIQKKKTPAFLHWYHHVSVLIFAWMSYSLGNSTMAVFGSMNIFVHTIMYGYFMICAMGLKKLVRPFAVYITLLQILQMVGGSALTFYSFFVNFEEYFYKGNKDVTTMPCMVDRQTATFGSLMYLSYLYLFSKMFINSYIIPKKPRGGNGAAAVEGNGAKKKTK